MKYAMTLAASVLTMAAPALAQTALTPLVPGETLLEVESRGEVTVRPDAAFVGVGVVTTGTTAAEATAANAEQMAKVIAAIRKAGVEERYVRTQQINVEPRFARANPSDDQGQPQITGYVARNGVNVTVVKLAVASDVIGAAFANGANSVSGPNLGLLDDSAATADARRDAIARAKAEADAYATALGLRVARILRVSERGRNASPVIYAHALASYAAVPPPPPPPPIATGEMRQSVTVWVDFALTK